MSKITDGGIIFAAFILAAGMMFANAKDLTAWMFITAGIFVYAKTWVDTHNQSDEDEDEDETDDEDEK